jgi:mycothiol system anti-sigma-R factor
MSGDEQQGTEETPCSLVVEQVWTYLDGEMDEAACESIRQHLDECVACLRQFGIEQEVKALVARSCGCDEPPTDLRDRVRARLTEVRIEITSTEITS